MRNIICVAAMLSAGCSFVEDWGGLHFAEIDAGTDSHVAMPDGGRDAGGGIDAGRDAGRDAGHDAGPPVGHLFPERNFECAAGALPPCATDVPATGDGARTHTLPATMGDTSYFFVLDYISVVSPDGTDPTQSIGLNLDGRDSGASPDGTAPDCRDRNPDFVGIAPDSQVGVDDQFTSAATVLGAGLACAVMTGEATIDCEVRGGIEQGNLLVVELSGVNDFMYDDEVLVQLATAVPVTDADPTRPGVQPALDPGTGRLMAGLDVRATPLGARQVADIYQGRLRVTTPIVLPIVTPTLRVMLHDVELRFDIAATGLTSGMLGGQVEVTELAAQSNVLMPGAICTTDADCAVGMCLSEPFPGGVFPDAMRHCTSSLYGTIIAVMSSLTDLAACTDPALCPWDTPGPGVCTRASAGARFEATTANVVP